MASRMTIDREGYPFEADNGYYVKYEDYVALEVKYENLRQAVEKAQRVICLELAEDDN